MIHRKVLHVPGDGAVGVVEGASARSSGLSVGIATVPHLLIRLDSLETAGSRESERPRQVLDAGARRFSANRPRVGESTIEEANCEGRIALLGCTRV
jgi:hypothetical protein